MTSQIDELTKLNEQYVSERSLSVKELETKYRTLVSDAETKVTQLDTEIVQKQTELQQYYDQINSYFYIDDDLKIKLVEEKSNNQHYWVAEVIASKINNYSPNSLIILMVELEKHYLVWLIA